MSNDIVFTNNASALLAVTINSTDLSIQVAAGYGANFPSPTGAQYFYLTLEDDAGTIEIVKITGRSADILSMDSVADRGQDGTTAATHTLNTTRCELRLIKSTMEEFLQKNGGGMTGDLDLNSNNLIDAYFTGSSTRMLAGQIVNVPLRGLLDTSTNEVAVPVDGTSRATVGGIAILAIGDDIVAELDTAGVIILDSATVGVVMDQAGAYFRMLGVHRIANTAGTDYLEQSHDDTDFNFAFTNTAEVNWDTLLNVTGGGIRMNDTDLVRPLILDFALKTQAVTAASTTAIDYELGSYVKLAMDVSISTLTFDNPPATHLGTFRLKITQGSGGQTIAWPASMKWPTNGAAPTLSTGGGDIDFVDIWTDDGGTTWYGAYDTDWAA